MEYGLLIYKCDKNLLSDLIMVKLWSNMVKSWQNMVKSGVKVNQEFVVWLCTYKTG
jgi:hypothetical protein